MFIFVWKLYILIISSRWANLNCIIKMYIIYFLKNMAAVKSADNWNQIILRVYK